MKLTIKAAAVLVLTLLLAKIAYVWSALDPLFNSNAWQHVYVMLATWFNTNGPEEGDNLVLVIILVVSLVLAVLLVMLGSRCIVAITRKAGQRKRT